MFKLLFSPLQWLVRNVYLAAILCGFLFIAGYFVFNAIQGPNGILKRIEIEAAQSVDQQILTALIIQRQRLENQTRRLSDDFLDLDLLDQQAREILGFIRTDEIIIR